MDEKFKAKGVEGEIFSLAGRGTQRRSHPGEETMAGSDVKSDATLVHCEIP